MRKLSRFQQRLEEIQKRVNEEAGDSRANKVKLHNQDPGTTEDQPTTKTAQPPKYHEKLWKRVDTIPPPYYKNIHIWDGEKIYYKWARVWSETMGDIFVNNHTDEVKTNILQWIDPDDITEYTDTIPDDCKILSVTDVKELLHKMEQLYQYLDESGSPYGCGYNKAIKDCITLLEKQLP